jgi:holdfast attachment protein HfaA
VILNSCSASWRLAAIALGALGLAGAADAQSMNANSAAYNAGYARAAAEENQTVDFGVRDAAGNLVVTDGIIQTGIDQSAFASAQASGAVDTFAGVGASASATAIGNNLNVVVQGDNNTVIVSSQQTNSGNVSASTH